MTIRMLQAWSGYPQQSIISLVAEEEARLVGLGLATTDLDGDAEGLSPVMASKGLTGGNTISIGSASTVLGERAYTKTCGDVVNGSGVLNGQLTDTGQAWDVSGAGYLTTVINGDHIEGTQNTYCHVNTGKKIAKAIQYYSGGMATVEIGLDNSLSDMIHCNFNSSGAAVITYWKSGVGTGLDTQWGAPVANCPDLNDGLPHKCELHVSGNFAFAYCDGILSAVAYDKNFPSITGNWFFAQIHGAGEKIYGVEAYSGSANADVESPTVLLEAVIAKAVSCNGITVGNPAGAGFAPTSSSYFWTDDEDGNVFGSDGLATVRARSASNGYGAKLVAQAAIGTETGVMSGNDGVGSIQHQNTDKIKFPFNAARIDMQTPVTLPVFAVSGLPAATVAYQRAFVSDALAPTFGATVAGGGTVKVPVYSDGTNWKVG